jgi:Protein of unknown function (DUF726)
MASVSAPTVAFDDDDDDWSDFAAAPAPAMAASSDAAVPSHNEVKAGAERTKAGTLATGKFNVAKAGADADVPLTYASTPMPAVADTVRDLLQFPVAMPMQPSPVPLPQLQHTLIDLVIEHVSLPMPSLSQTNASQQHQSAIDSSTRQNVDPTVPDAPRHTKQVAHASEPEKERPPETEANTLKPMVGLNALDNVQRYGVGALSSVLLASHLRSGDMNGAAFARSLVTTVFSALGLAEQQQDALLALEPEDVPATDAVVIQCAGMIGDEAVRFTVVQALLALSVAGGVYDARSRAFLMAIAFSLRVEWTALAAVELAVAIQLVEEAATAEDEAAAVAAESASASASPSAEDASVNIDDFDTKSTVTLPSAEGSTRRSASAALAARRLRKQKSRRAIKVSGITLVGGLLFGVTGGLIAPALLSALAGVGMASAAGLAASGSVASGAVVGSLFGVAGAGISGKKAHHRMGSILDEFDFERDDDPRVIDARKRKAERAAAKAQKAALRAAKAEPPRLAIEDASASDAQHADDSVATAPTTATGSGSGRGFAVASSAYGEDDVDSMDGDDVAVTNGNHYLPPPPKAHPSFKLSRRCETINVGTIGSPAKNVKDADDDEDNDSSDEDGSVAGASIENGKGRNAISRMLNRPSSSKKDKAAASGPAMINVGARGLDSIGQIPGLHVCICVPGWLQDRQYGSSLDQFEQALIENIPCSQHIMLRWESRRLYEMSLAFAKFWASKATVTTIQQAYPHALAAASSVAGAVAFAFAIPLTVISCLDYIDNPWSVMLSRSNVAGDALADVLIERSYGQRPVTLVGYSLGARVVFKCLEALASRGALGIVDNVFLLGAPVTADPERWRRVTPVVAGRIVNGHQSNDWALAFFHRGCGHGVFVAGLRRVEVDRVENVDMALVGMDGHRELKECIPRALRAMGIGTGYVVMPPAPLVRRKKAHDASKDSSAIPTSSSLVDLSDEVGDVSGSLQGDHRSRSNPSPGKRRARSTLPSYVDTNMGKGNLQITDGSVEESTTKPQIDIDAMWASEVENISMATKARLASEDASGEGSEVSKGNKKKSSGKAKLPSWISSSLGSWNSSGGSSQRRKVTSSGGRPATSQALQGTVDDSWVPPVMIGDGLAENGSEASVRGVVNHKGRKEEDEEDEVVEVEPVAATATTSASFDWEIQRRIWEEQERQLQENGVANAPINLADVMDDGKSVVLGIAVEITGRRLKNFVPQDTELPMPPTTEIYTNCVNEQEAIVFRIYEHEKNSRIVPLDPTAPGADKFPKLLGELTLRWWKRAAKGKLRFAISVSVNEAGDVIARAEERHREGSIGASADLVVPRCHLCTMLERREREEAESRRLAAEALAVAAAAETQAEPRLALPAPEVQPNLNWQAPSVAGFYSPASPHSRTSSPSLLSTSVL